MDGDSENCRRLHGLRHEQREAQHGVGGGGDDGANPHLNLRLEYKTTFFKENMPIDSRPSMCVIMVIV